MASQANFVRKARGWMRVFRHGDSLAIVVPPSIKSSSSISENDEYHFFELEPGIFVLISDRKLSKSVEQSVVSQLVARAMAAKPAGSAARQDPGAQLPYPAPKSNSNSVAVPSFVSASELAKSAGAQNSVESHLGGRGFGVLDETDAKRVSKALEVEIGQGFVYGAKGLDKRFYVITRDEFEGVSPRLSSILQKGVEIDPKQAALALKEDEMKVLCALQVLKEQGEALEKHKGIFVLL